MAKKKTSSAFAVKQMDYAGDHSANTIKEALTSYKGQEALDYKTQKKATSSITTLNRKLDDLIAGVERVPIQTYDKNNSISRRMLSELKVRDLQDQKIINAISNALANSDGWFAEASNRGLFREKFNGFAKRMGAGDLVTQKVKAALGSGRFSSVFNTKADRSLIQILNFDSEKLSKGFANILSELKDKPKHAQVFSLLVTGGFRPSDIERMTVGDLRRAVETGVLTYQSKVKNGVEGRYRPVLPEHRAIYEKVLSEIDLANMSEDVAEKTRAFPQNKAWKTITSDLNKSLALQFGDKFLHVYRPHMDVYDTIPMSNSMLRHYMESRLARIGMVDVESRQLVMGRSAKGLDLGMQYADIASKVGPGSQAYNLAAEANNILTISLTGTKDASNAVFTDFYPQEVRSSLMLPNAEVNPALSRPLNPQILINSPYNSLTGLPAATLDPFSDQLALQNINDHLDNRRKLIEAISYKFNIDPDVVVAEKLHLAFANIPTFAQQTATADAIPREQRTIKDLLASYKQYYDIAGRDPLNKAQTRSLFSGLNQRHGVGQTSFAELVGSSVADDTNPKTMIDPDSDADEIVKKNREWAKKSRWGGVIKGVGAVGTGMAAYSAFDEAQASVMETGGLRNMPTGEKIYHAANILTAPVTGFYTGVPLVQAAKDAAMTPRSAIQGKMERRSDTRLDNEARSELKKSQMGEIQGTGFTQRMREAPTDEPYFTGPDQFDVVAAEDAIQEEKENESFLRSLSSPSSVTTNFEGYDNIGSFIQKQQN